ENESHMHASGKGSESHFRCVIVSASFEGQSLLTRHRAVYDALSESMVRGVHALAIHAYTPNEWALRGVAPASPACGGRR
ncbi:MAG TPA: BolA family transcriptional regulator, partial [Halothiobacillus sp.]|nr:BolA family transcriptional regulator [Halothiobacillus sp.]